MGNKERYLEEREKAKKNIYVADHMLTQTYPLVQDNKLLLAVLSNLSKAIDSAIGLALYHERMKRSIPPFHDNHVSKLKTFSECLLDKYKVDKEELEMLKTVDRIIQEHEESPVEFNRKEKLVICDDDYKMTTISIDDLKSKMRSVKDFVHKIMKTVDTDG